MSRRPSASRLRRWMLSAALLATVAVTSGAASPSALSRPLPSSMAAAGDSITRAFDADWLHLVSDAPAYSWSTGDSSLVDSQYERLLAANPQIAGRALNLARTGGRVSALADQLRVAASARVGYLTVLIGADDVCTHSVAAMTPTDTFESEFTSALRGFIQADPQAKVFVASIPDVYQLWSVLHDDPSARGTWDTFGICPSMLSPADSQADRLAVRSRIVADNEALRRGCARWRQCRYDGGATFRFRFSAGQISTIDYFHPSLSGQRALAEATWAAGWWPGV